MGRLLWTGLVLWLVSLPQVAASQSGELLNVDYRSLVSRADLRYGELASRSEEGMPVGNGRMGSLVWTMPSTLRFQINRVDVFAEDSTTTSFPVQDSDHASACAYVDTHVVSAGGYGGEGAIEPLGSEKEMKSRFLNFNRLASFIDSAGIGGAQIFRNRMRLREGPGAIDCEHIGGLTSGIHSSLLRSSPEVEAGEPVIEVFSSWPKDWDAAFTLLARGAFQVSSSQEKGQIGFVRVKSLAGGECRLRNPWPDKTVTIYRGEEQVREQSGARLSLPMQTGETLLVVVKDVTPLQRNVP